MKKSVTPATVPDKAAYHHGDLRRSLLDAALGLVESHGVQGFTLREAARAANVSHNAPYRHFPSRTHLLIALAIEGQGHLLQGLQTAVRRATDARERIVRLGTAYMEFAISHAAHFRVMFSSDVARNRTADLTAAQNATFEFFENELLATEQGGLIRQGAVQNHALVGWSALHGAAMLVLDGVLDNTAIAARRKPREMAHLIIETLLTGILAPD
ncbi:MAG: TetR family transcriptional regulator [Planctomycetaceae bacterium]|nr:TetR family transcriptional regulator [Planctomycetaceae bacterium]